MARILIHWHPQGSYIARSYIESLLLLGTKQVVGHSLYILPGPSFMNQPLSDIKKRSIGPLSLFPQSNTTTVFDHFHKYQFRGPGLEEKAQYLSYDYLSNELSIDNNSAVLLSNAIKDTLHRGCLKQYRRFQLYSDWDGEYWRKCYIHRLGYVLQLYRSYEATLRTCAPDVVAMSHPNYDIYIALYIAARELGIPSIIVNGGYHLSYLCTPSNKLIDPSPQSARGALLNAYIHKKETRVPVDCYVDSRSTNACISLGHLDESPINQLQDHYMRLNKENCAKEYRACEYVLFIPILGEVNHHDCLAQLAFRSKPSWISETIKQLADIGLSYFYYRHHPLVDVYSERKIVERLIQLYSKKYLIQAIDVSSQSAFSAFIDECEESNKVAEVLALGSNISTELAASGIRPIIANPCFASAGQLQTRSQLEISKEVRIDKIFTSEGENDASACDIRKVVNFTSLIGKGNSYDHEWRNIFDNRYFFGKSVKQYDAEEVSESYLAYLTQFEPYSVKSDLGLHYYTKKAVNSQNGSAE